MSSQNRILASTLIPKESLISSKGISQTDGSHQTKYLESGGTQALVGMNYISENTFELNSSSLSWLAKLYAR